MRVTIAARQSDLARLQAQTVGAALKAAHQNTVHSDLQVEFHFRASLGDLNQQDPLWKMPEKGVFTEDFLDDLIQGRVDMVVHSWKDLPTEPREQTEIVATLPRADTRDLLLVRADRIVDITKSRHLRVLTSSPRRAYNLEGFLRDFLPFGLNEIEFLNVRGNIPTRMRKLLNEDVDALIVAKAALDRLLEADAEEYLGVQAELRRILSQCRWAVLPLGANPTAAAQGALAIEIRRDRADLRQLLSAIHCAETFACVEKERKILASYGGGCHQKIGVTILHRPFGEVTYLRGLTDAGEILDRASLQGSQTDAKALPAKALPSKAASASALWPAVSENDDGGFFQREPMAESAWRRDFESARFLYITRESALPASAQPSSEQIVWCAGLKTWRKLAARGIWVHGSSESLGEAEPARIRTLAGVAPGESLVWVKLTHEAFLFSGEETPGLGSGEAIFRPLATYRLQPRSSAPDLHGKTHFYWMSGSTFDRALALYPEIRNASHASGPGRTHRHLRSRLGDDTPVAVYLSREEWVANVLQEVVPQRSDPRRDGPTD